MSQPVTLSIEDGVAILSLNNGHTNPIDSILLGELSTHLRTLEIDPDVHSIVLTSSSLKFFSIGLALPIVHLMDREEFTIFFHNFTQLCIDLYRFPKPTVCAITGHAIAGGCILALCTDYRFMSDAKALMGLNEIKLGVPVPYPSDRMLTSLVGPSTARDIMESGDFYPPEESLIMGLADELHPRDDVITTAISKARLLGSNPSRAYQMIKGNRIGPVLKDIERYRSEREKYFIDCWFSADTRLRLEEALKKF